ncbi:MAG: hypothetical protein E6194_02730, partial [Finegoldia magna]|nr:hypothetical protein [Finegoldia magna]
LFRENLPGVTENFSDLCGTVFKDGKLSLKEKEFLIEFFSLRIKNWLNTMKYNKRFKDERKYENYGS